ncbi:hypothetical protein Q3G72_001556 [Acer saccharum]|nr:hypothetical protein Q3G72_001556 [Acer saccharum]
MLGWLGFERRESVSAGGGGSVDWEVVAVWIWWRWWCCRSSVQPLHLSVDYFQIYGLDKNYEIGDENLERKYKDWQKKLHPDLVHSKSQEREYAAEHSARVIEAYHTLTNPLSRAIYILKLEGIEVNEEETVSEPELLTELQAAISFPYHYNMFDAFSDVSGMLAWSSSFWLPIPIMETREAVEDAADSKALNEILSPVQEKKIQWSKSFANAFRSRKFDESLTCIWRMTYYDRVNKEIMKKL